MKHTMSVALVEENKNLSQQAREFVEYLADRVFQFGENFGIAVKKDALAEAYGKNVRTITRYIKELEDKEVIETATKTGKDGGIVIMFTDDNLDFEPTDNPITKKSMTAEEVKEMLYPNKKKKEPKKKYRSKTEIAEERVLKARRRSKIDELNEQLLTMDYPTKEFWMQTPNPELYYRAYLSASMYNFYAVYFPTMQMHKAEAKGDIYRYEFYKIERDKYANYDVLKKDFLGTSTFTNFLKFAEVMVNNNIDPAQYLTVQFQHMQFLMDMQSASVKLPYPNTLVSVDSARRWLGTYEYKKQFRKDHPYYAVSGDTVQTEGLSYPILTELVQAFQEPFKETPDVYTQQIEATISNRIYVPKMIQSVYDYGRAIKAKIKDTDKLNTTEKQELTKFIEQETANHMVSDQVLTLVTYASVNQIADMKVKSLDDKNLRYYYHNVGNSGLEYKENPIEIRTNVKRGYRADFSLFGAKTFLNTINMLKSIRGIEVDFEVVGEAILKFGENKIPLTEHGFLDAKAIRRKVMTEKELAEEKLMATPVMKHADNVVDIFGELWYDVSESTLGESSRDGRGVHK